MQTGLNTPRAGSFKQLMLAKKTSNVVVDPGAIASSATVVRMREAPAATERAEMLSGTPAEIAGRIISLVRGEAV